MDLFLKLIDKLQDGLSRLKLISEKVSIIDILNSFSKRAIKYKYSCPDIIEEKRIGWHISISCQRIRKVNWFIEIFF